MRQLELPLSSEPTNIPKRATPEPGVVVRVFYKHPTQEWPGSPLRQTVTVLDGVLEYVIPADTRPEGHLMEKGIVPYAAKRSKYERWVLRLGYRRFKVVTMDHQHTWALLSECR